MRKYALARALWLWLPPLLWMALIFALSSMPADDVERGFGHFLLRKAAHIVEYAVLTALWWRALRTSLPHKRALAAAFAISVAYAVTDEYHQTFVETRVGTAWDVVVDAVGAALAVVVIHRLVVRSRRRRART